MRLVRIDCTHGVGSRIRPASAQGFIRGLCEHLFVMRWDNLERGASTQGTLRGLGESTVRTFDAPEAVGIRFHEVEARSALNRVPERSRMPFGWTINAYRGCTHACVLAGLLLR
jgi:hypothetical protein